MSLSHLLRHPFTSILIYAPFWVCGCSKTQEASEASPVAASASAAPSAGAASGSDVAVKAGIPIPRERVLDQVNRDRLPVYAGKTGTVRGFVVATGDPAPEAAEFVATIPDKCPLARELYSTLFREGMNRALADVFVSVTGYEGYIPAKNERVLVEARGCTWQTRTIGVMYGQRLEVIAADMTTYAPKLVGAQMPAQMFVMPRGEPVALYPNQPGRYLLVDSSHPFSSAEVLVVKYPTFDVTGLDGRFEITGVPPGKLTLGAVLPAIRQAVEQPVEVVADEVTEVRIRIPFDASLVAPASAAKPMGSAP
jgi:hypothetical protein